MIEQLSAWTNNYLSNIIWSVAVLLIYLSISRLLLPRIEASVDRSNLKSETALKAFHISTLLMGTVAIAALFIVWGIDFNGLLLVSTSLITLTGVALFANWSILSSVTSYFILLFHDSFRRGNFIRIIEGENYTEGFISEIQFFYTKILTEERDIIIYPNNLLLTRQVQINPRHRWQVMGKVSKDSVHTEKKPAIQQ